MVEEERAWLVQSIKTLRRQMAEEADLVFATKSRSFQEQKSTSYRMAQINRHYGRLYNELIERLYQLCAAEESGDILVMNPVEPKHVEMALRLIDAA